MFFYYFKHIGVWPWVSAVGAVVSFEEDACGEDGDSTAGLSLRGEWGYVLKRNPRAEQAGWHLEITPRDWIMPNCHFPLEERGLGVVVREQNLKTTSE